MTKAPSHMQQNYDRCCEDAINTHIRLLLHASYMYLSMAFYFDSDDVALGNFKHFFLSKAHDCKASVEMLVFLQNKHGGYAFLPSIPKPDRRNWQGGLRAMECSFCMEMKINQCRLNQHELAKGKGDSHLCCFLEQHFLDEQVPVLKKKGGYLTDLSQMGAREHSLAQYLFDKLSLA